MQTTLPRIIADCIFSDLRDPLANRQIRPALVDRQPAHLASDFLIMPESLEKETVLVPKGRAQARLLDTGLLLDQGKGCLLIPLLPEDLHHLGENFVDVEFTRPCHWAPPFILLPGEYQFFTARSRIKFPAPRPYPQDEAKQDLDVGRAKKAMTVFGREFSPSTQGAHAAPIGTVTRTLTSGRAPQ